MEQRLHTKLNAGVCATVLQRHGEHVLWEIKMESSEKKFTGNKKNVLSGTPAHEWNVTTSRQESRTTKKKQT